MQIISLIVDTNVLLCNLNIVKQLAIFENIVKFYIYVTKAVIVELDKLKMSMPEARDAINFLYNTQCERIVLEGDTNTNIIEVDVGHVQKIEELNNDDKILNFAKTKEDAIILTNDHNFILKCINHKVDVVNLEHNKLEICLHEIFLRKKVVFDQKDTQNWRNFKAKQIQKAILSLIFKEFGDYYAVEIYHNTLEGLLSCVYENFNIFQKYLSKHSKKDIWKLISAIKTQNIEEIEKYLEKVAYAFNLSNKK